MKYKLEGHEITGGVPVDDEGPLTRDVSRYLGRLKATGKIMKYYHRPDRAAAHGERGGLPDFVICFAPGYVGGLELKRRSERPSEAQARWLVGFGCLGAVARNMGGAAWWVDQVIDWLEHERIRDEVISASWRKRD